MYSINRNSMKVGGKCDFVIEFKCTAAKTTAKNTRQFSPFRFRFHRFTTHNCQRFRTVFNIHHPKHQRVHHKAYNFLIVQLYVWKYIIIIYIALDVEISLQFCNFSIRLITFDLYVCLFVYVLELASKKERERQRVHVMCVSVSVCVYVCGTLGSWI